MKLENRVALVTGGTQGIGQAIAERMAADGAFVIVIASKDLQRAESVAAGIRAMGARAGAEVADVTSREQIRALVGRVVETWGRVDILVNCAGVFVPTPAGEHADAAVDRTIDINLKGTFNSIDAVVPHMKARRSGKIINIASVAGVMGIGGYAMYCATKAGIVMLTRALACELAPHGININAIAPGNTATPMNADIRTDAAFEPMLQAMAARTPSGRVYSTPVEMAAMASFLASDDARAMHGSTVLMDEGFSAGL